MLQIVWIDLLLSGDNAVVIALACRGLRDRQRLWAITGGAGAAVGLRIVLVFFVVALLRIPYVKLAAGLLLLWIAFDLLRSDEKDEDVDEASSVWGAIRTIAVADAVMSLDNVVAVTAAAKSNVLLVIFGIALTIPFIVFGSTFLLKLLERFPILVVAGSALLAWVAGEILVSDPVLERWLGPLPAYAEYAAGAVGALLMLAIAGVLRLVGRKRAAAAGD